MGFTWEVLRWGDKVMLSLHCPLLSCGFNVTTTSNNLSISIYHLSWTVLQTNRLLCLDGRAYVRSKLDRSRMSCPGQYLDIFGMAIRNKTTKALGKNILTIISSFCWEGRGGFRSFHGGCIWGWHVLARGARRPLLFGERWFESSTNQAMVLAK